MSQQPETLPGQAALDALARETTPCPELYDATAHRALAAEMEGACSHCRGSRVVLRYPRLSRKCGLPSDRHSPECMRCRGTDYIILPIDTAAVGPLLETLLDMDAIVDITQGGQYGISLGLSMPYQTRPFDAPTPEAALLAALTWADAQRKETP